MRRRLTRLAVLGLTAGLALAACSASEDPVTGDGPSLADCDQDPTGCNSGERAGGGQIIWLINQGWDGVWNQLTVLGNSTYLNQAERGIIAIPGEWQPGEQEWQWNLDLWAEEPQLVEEDPQTLVYRIREEAVWNDGTPITADDLEFLWRALSGSPDHCTGCEPPATTGFADVASIEGSEGGKTVTITYRDGAADPEWFVRHQPFYPPHVVAAAGIDWRTPEGMAQAMDYFSQNVPDWSAGPYLIETAVVDERVEMVPNPAWYGETQPTLERMVKLVVSEQSAWMPALENEELQGGWPASWTVDFYQQLQDQPGMLSYAGSGGGVWEHVDFNMDSVTDPALRKAIFTTIDTARAREAIWGDIAPTIRTNPIFSETSPYHEDFLAGTGYGSGDVEAARSILAEAGYTGFEAGGELVGPDGNPVPALRFAYLDGNENRATFTELAQSVLSEIGLSVEPEATAPDQLGTVLRNQDYDLVIFGWQGTPTFTGSPHQFYHSSSGSNYGKLNNPQIDELAERVRSQIDVADSAALANELVPLVMEEAYLLPLWDSPQLVFVNDGYTNLRPNLNSSVNPQYNSEEWGVAAVE